MSTPRIIPSFEEIRQLPADFSMEVPPDWEDRNGHVNVQYYQTLYGLGGWQILENIGIDEKYLAQYNGGIFDLEHHTRYLAEIHVGETVSLHNRMFGKNDQLFHGIFYILNETNQALSCSIEYLSAYIDLNVRRVAPFPQDMVTKLDKLLSEHSAMNWQSPVCGAIST